MYVCMYVYDISVQINLTFENKLEYRFSISTESGNKFFHFVNYNEQSLKFPFWSYLGICKIYKEIILWNLCKKKKKKKSLNENYKQTYPMKDKILFF